MFTALSNIIQYPMITSLYNEKRKISWQVFWGQISIGQQIPLKWVSVRINFVLLLFVSASRCWMLHSPCLCPPVRWLIRLVTCYKQTQHSIPCFVEETIYLHCSRSSLPFVCPALLARISLFMTWIGFWTIPWIQPGVYLDCYRTTLSVC